MRIIQVTDLHIGLPGQATQGVDVRQNFISILKAVHELGPDALVLSGDLCFDTGEAEIYQWIRDELRVFDCTLYLLSGNHDDPRLLAEVFGVEELLEGEELYYRVEIGGRSFLFLDTTTGVISADQLAWFEKQLEGSRGEALVFMHHPPAEGGVPYMDNNHGLQNYADFQRLARSYGQGVRVFCGHFHVDKMISLPGLEILITPSTYFQIDQEREDFGVDHYRIGFRLLEWEGSVFKTRVHYLEGHRND